MKTLVLLFSLTFSISYSFGQTFVNQSATGNNSGISWENAYTSLTDALDNTSSGEIWIATGTYKPNGDTLSSFIVNSEIDLYGGFSGSESTKEERDISSSPTILSGDLMSDDIVGDLTSNKTDNSRTILYIDSLLQDIVIDGLIVSNGFSRLIADGEEYYWSGGGIFTYSTVHISNSVFLENVGRRGGAITISSGANSGHDSTFENIMVEGNSSISQSIIFVSGANNVSIDNSTFNSNFVNRGCVYPLLTDNFKLTNSTFSNNTDAGSWGGALFSWNNTNLLIEDCTFDTNASAGSAGAIYLDGRLDTLALHSADNIIFRNCEFLNNSANFGGAIYTWQMSMTVEDCTFKNNSATGDGGAISNYGNSGKTRDFVCKNSTFENNSGNFGGGLVCGGLGATFDFENNTFTENSCVVSGGSMLVGFGADCNFENCEFTLNTANFGGSLALQDSATTNVSNCTFNQNMSNNNAGAINVLFNHTLNISNSTFDFNSTGSNGGVIAATRNETTGPGFITISNSFFTFNECGNQGGVIDLQNFNLDAESNVFAFNNNIGEGAGGVISANASTDFNIDVSLTNNTFHENFAALGSSIAAFTDESAAISNVTLQNNIFSEPNNNAIEVDGGTPSFVSDGGNISIDDSGVNFLTGPNDINEATNLNFNDPEDLNFRLNLGSVAINNGIASDAPEFDIDGNERIMEPESGAYEFDPTTSLKKEIVDNNSVSIFPNPVIHDLNFTIDNNWIGRIEYEIYSINGTKIKDGSFIKSDQIQQVTIENLNFLSGNYYLIISTENKAIVEPLIKQ